MADSQKDWRPVNPGTGEPLPQCEQPGYYPGFQTLSQQAFWDEATRKVIRDRVENIPPVRFFSASEAELMSAVCNRILPQDDRDDAHKISVVNYIDERLFENRLDGYRYAGMPSDQEAHRLGLQAIQEIAQYMYRKPFIDLRPIEQEWVLKSIHDGYPPAGQQSWNRMPVSRYWMLLVQDVVGAYYAHPYAWDEIGFGGPAYPRGYMRLEHGEPEPWEVRECRHPWAAPPNAPSAESTHVAGVAEHKASPAQGGTH